MEIQSSGFLLQHSCSTSSTIVRQCPNLHHERISVFSFCVTGLDHWPRYQASLFFSCMKQNLFYFFFTYSINALLKRVWFILMEHCILLDFKQNTFKWNQCAAKMLLLTLKTITLKYIHGIGKGWYNRVDVKKCHYIVHGFPFSINVNPFRCALGKNGT